MAVRITKPDTTELQTKRARIATLMSTGAAPTPAEIKTHVVETDVERAKANEQWRAMANARATLLLIIVGVAPGLVLLVGAWNEDGKMVRDHWNWGGVAFKYHASAALATAAVWLVVSMLLGPSKGGLVRTFVGKGNRLSTSKLQVLLWTFAVSYAFLLFVTYLATSGKTTGFDTLNGDYLFLLGGPFAAALLAQAATVSKLQNNTVQQADAATPSSSDVVEDTAGRSSATDAQFLVFNIVALIYFFVALIRASTELPDLPDTLVGLTSVSALAYVGGKLTNNNAPVIKSITILSGSTDGLLHDGAVIRILGDNFFADSAPEVKLQTVALFGAIEVVPTKAFNTELTVTSPAGLPTGPVEIRVRTGANAVSNPYTQLQVG